MLYATDTVPILSTAVFGIDALCAVAYSVLASLYRHTGKLKLRSAFEIFLKHVLLGSIDVQNGTGFTERSSNNIETEAF